MAMAALRGGSSPPRMARLFDGAMMNSARELVGV
jgi:hypothetical protein